MHLHRHFARMRYLSFSMLSKVIYIVILSVALPFYVCGQDLFPSKFVSNNSGIGMSFGLSSYQLGGTRDLLTAQYPDSFGPFLLHYGMSYSSVVDINQKRQLDTHIDLMLYDNHGNSGTTDSLRYSWSGWHFGWDQGFDTFPKVKYLDVIVGFGFNWGRFKLVRDSKMSESSINTNPFFAPKFILEPRFTLGKLFMIGIRSELAADITRGRWKKKQNGLNDIGNTRATGANLMVTISAALN